MPDKSDKIEVQFASDKAVIEYVVFEFGLKGVKSVLLNTPLASELSDNVNDQVPEETTSNLRLTSSPKQIEFFPKGLGESVKVAVGL